MGLAGFVLSVIANLWNVALTIVRWPRVSVETRAYVYGRFGPPDPDEPRPGKIVLTVINRGAEAVTIGNIGLRAEDHSQQRDFENDELHSYDDKLPEGSDLVFPVRVEGHGALKWVYGPEQLAEFRDGISVRGYAKAYRSFRWRRQITERIIEAPRTALIQ